MTTQHVKVGDVVAWNDVPIGAIVRGQVGIDRRHWIRCQDGAGIRIVDPWGRWHEMYHICLRWRILALVYRIAKHPVTIIALGLTGNETADGLRALAEAFERDHPAA